MLKIAKYEAKARNGIDCEHKIEDLVEECLQHRLTENNRGKGKS